MPDLADEVYLLCLAVTGWGSGAGAASEAAAAALRRGGWSRTMVLGHGAREAARAASADPGGPGPEAPGPPGPTARWLAGCRPAGERAVLHLADRAGLGGARLARALGVPEGEAAGALATAAAAWSAGLDPALMAWLGPGDCAGLAEILAGGRPGPAGEADGAGPDGAPSAPGLTAREARDLAPAVSTHVAGCPACADRLRAMVSVRDLLAREPAPPAPPGLRSLARISRARPPTPLDRPVRAARPRRPALAAGVIGLAAAGAGAVVYLAWPAAGPPSPAGAADAALSRLPPGGSVLVLDPPATGRTLLHLSDVGRRSVTWQAATTAAWLQVAPATGRLVPGQSVQLDLNVVGAPVAGLRATVTVNGSDGSVAAATYVPQAAASP